MPTAPPILVSCPHPKPANCQVAVEEALAETDHAIAITRHLLNRLMARRNNLNRVLRQAMEEPNV